VISTATGTQCTGHVRGHKVVWAYRQYQLLRLYIVEADAIGLLGLMEVS